jgi:threonine synthase
VMLFNCATGLKYPLPRAEKALDRHQPIDYAQFGSGSGSRFEKN